MLQKSSRLIIYYRTPPERDRFFTGDRHLRPLLRQILRGKRIGGVEKVFNNLCKSLTQLNVPYFKNLPFNKLSPNDWIVVIGSGRYSLAGYNQPNKIVAGIGLMTHPSEWPSLLKDYPVVKYLQHSEWAKNVYCPFFGEEVCDTWFAGIDTEKWKPDGHASRKYDFLIYNKIRWDHKNKYSEFRDPIIQLLNKRRLSYKEIIYGHYNERQYRDLLKKSKAMIFLCEHESQGFACCEALSMNVPVFAWDQGFCLDPDRFKWKEDVIRATSVPFFNQSCGETFKGFEDFENKLFPFLEKLRNGNFNPRDYVIENLSLEKSGLRLLEILHEAYENRRT